MTNSRIVITRPLPGDPAQALCEAGFDNIVANPEDRRLEPAELHEMVSGAHGVLTTPMDRVQDAFFEATGPQLRIVSNYAVGYDNIDTTEAKRRGVIIGHTPNAVTEPTADIAWLLILAAARRAGEGMDLVRGGNWKGVSPNELLGTRLVGKTLLIVGAGRIGLATARRSIGWDMPVLYHARSAHPEFEAAPINGQPINLEAGLAAADVVSIHTPLGPETRHLINAQRIALMKPSSILVNTSRGAVIDEAAMYEALRDGQIAAAGLDVYENEPKLHPGLAALDNVFLLPHLGSATTEDREWMARIAVENLLAALRDQPVPHRVV